MFVIIQDAGFLKDIKEKTILSHKIARIEDALNAKSVKEEKSFLRVWNWSFSGVICAFYADDSIGGIFPAFFMFQFRLQ